MSMDQDRRSHLGNLSKGQLNRRSLLTSLGGAITLADQPQGASPKREMPPSDPTFGRSLVFEETFDRLEPAIWEAGAKATTIDPGYYGHSAFAPYGGIAGYNPYDIVSEPTATDGRALALGARYIGAPLGVHGYFGNNRPASQWVSGNIQTARKDGAILKGWRRGYFEARMWMPAHPQTWAAFWLMNGRSILHPRTSIEIDVVEHKGWEPRLYGTYLHEWGQPGEHHEGVGVPVEQDLTAGFHKFGVLVTDDACTPYFDGRPVVTKSSVAPLVWRISRSTELDRDADVFWPLLTLAITTDRTGDTLVSEDQRDARLLVDYLRVYA